MRSPLAWMMTFELRSGRQAGPSYGERPFKGEKAANAKALRQAGRVPLRNGKPANMTGGK